MNNNEEYSIRSDSDGKPLEGENNYLLKLPSGIPECKFWSVIVFDENSGLIIHTSQSWPSVHSHCNKLVSGHDKSVEILFGPEAPESTGKNWIQTMPGKRWYAIVRLYDILPENAAAEWKPGQIIRIK